MPDEGKCCNCGGEHVPAFLVCLVRVKENEVARGSYLEAVRKLEGTSGREEVMVVEPPRIKSNQMYLYSPSYIS